MSYLQKLRGFRGMPDFPEDTLDTRALQGSVAIRTIRKQGGPKTVSFDDEEKPSVSEVYVVVQPPLIYHSTQRTHPTYTFCW